MKTVSFASTPEDLDGERGREDSDDGQALQGLAATASEAFQR